MRRLAREGVPINRIVRATGLSRGLVRRIVRGEQGDIFRARQYSLTPWLPRLEREWTGGCPNVTELRLRASGFGGSLRVVGEWATRQRRVESAVLSGSGRCPPARSIAQLMTSACNHLSKADAVLARQIEAALPDLAVTGLLVDRFNAMVRNGAASDLVVWLEEAAASEIASFSRGLAANQAAVAAALREPWSNGQTEGQINHLKTLRRQMYGRASIKLLKAHLVAAS